MIFIVTARLEFFDSIVFLILLRRKYKRRFVNLIFLIFDRNVITCNFLAFGFFLGDFFEVLNL